MSETTTTLNALTTPHLARTIARWMVSFIGFPLGGLAAMVVVGAVDSTARAIAGGLVTGATLGLAQAWGMRADLRGTIGWFVTTAIGLSVGLAVGATVVDFGTSVGDLAVQGAISGSAVGAAQVPALLPRLGRIAFGWPGLVAAAWTAGWTVTTAVGVQVEDHFTVFGAAGAITVTLLTAVLPLLTTTRRN